MAKDDHFQSLRQVISHYLHADQVEQIHQAYLLAENAHKTQSRISGEPYITHPVAVATILADMQLDAPSIMAAIMHDVIEDTPVEKVEIADKFGQEVAELVDGVSKLTQIQFETRAEAQAENFRKMLLAMVQDIRVILIKLSDRLHNMRTLHSLSREKCRRIATETLEIYAPIAKRLGMHNFYVEFEDLSFAALYPSRYEVLKQAVQEASGNRQVMIEKITKALRHAITEQNIEVKDIWGREKHIYSIYKKMRKKNLSFAEVMDVYGFRIVIPSTDECYRVLGIAHKLYKPLAERFKDYIAIPKANGYQSLHTTLFGPYGIPIEIQIRTVDMEKMAESGIAAHWRYKSGGENIASEAHERARDWLKHLLDIQQSTGTSLEFIENVKIDLFPDEVYVFTPSGEIFELPAGACAVDFAYAIHSDIGNSCVAAKIDRRLAPLSTPLRNGQTVEIITAPGAQPNPAWLHFVVTGKARSNIRHYIKSQQASESIGLGKRLLDSALNVYQSDFTQVAESAIHELLQSLGYRNLDHLYESIGLGNQLAMVVASRLMQSEATEQQTTQQKMTTQPQPLLIKGSEGMVVSFAECCRPIPNDPIVGILASGRGLVIHSESCKQVDVMRRQNPAKLIPVRWQDQVSGDFKVELRIEVFNQRGVLARLATIIADCKSNIDNITVDQRDGKYNLILLTLTVTDREHLAYIMRHIRHVSFVEKVTRA